MHHHKRFFLLCTVMIASVFGCRRTVSPQANTDATNPSIVRADVQQDTAPVTPDVVVRDTAVSSGVVQWQIVAFDSGISAGLLRVPVLTVRTSGVARDVVVGGEYEQCRSVAPRDIALRDDSESAGVPASAVIAAIECARPRQATIALVRGERGYEVLRSSCPDAATRCAVNNETITTQQAVSNLPEQLQAEPLIERTTAPPVAPTGTEITLRFERSGAPFLDDDPEHFEPQTFLVLQGALQLRLAFGTMLACDLMAPRGALITGATCSIGDHYIRNVSVERRGNRLQIKYNASDDMSSPGPMRLTRTINLPQGAVLRAIAGDIAPREEAPNDEK